MNLASNIVPNIGTSIFTTYGSKGIQLNRPLLYNSNEIIPNPIPQTALFISSTANCANTAPKSAGSKKPNELLTESGSMFISLDPTITPTTSIIIFTKTDAETPIVDIIEPSSVPTLVSVALRAAAAQGILRLLILPDKKEIYVPGIPNIGKNDIGSINRKLSYNGYR